MRYCSNCGSDVLEESHFCPNCMYVFPRVETTQHINDIPKNKNYKRRIIAIILSVTVVYLMVLVGGIVAIPTLEKDIKNRELERKKQQEKLMKEVFYTGEDIAYDSRIKEDLRDSLTNDSPEVIIDYSTETNPYDKGVFGCCGDMTKAEVVSVLGTPYQNFVDEYVYTFDGIIGAPLLKIYFEDGKVVYMEYYRTFNPVIEDE